MNHQINQKKQVIVITLHSFSETIHKFFRIYVVVSHLLSSCQPIQGKYNSARHFFVEECVKPFTAR